MVNDREVITQKLLGVVIGTAIGVPLSIYIIDPAISPYQQPKLLAQYIAAVVGFSTVMVTSDLWIAKIRNSFSSNDKEETEEKQEEVRVG